MEVVEVNEYSEELLQRLNKLLPQLSFSAEPITSEVLRVIIANPTVHLLVAQDEHNLFGTLSLVVFPTITGTRAWIEDVVVSEAARGRGVGKLLSGHALNLATGLGAKTVDLTSRPDRRAANELYKKVGFKLRETNLYRYSCR